MKIVLTDKAQKELGKLPQQELKKVSKKIRVLESLPLLGKKLSGQFSGQYSLRSDPYRIIYYFSIGTKTITIDHVEHRQGVYM